MNHVATREEIIRKISPSLTTTVEKTKDNARSIMNGKKDRKHLAAEIRKLKKLLHAVTESKLT